MLGRLAWKKVYDYTSYKLWKHTVTVDLAHLFWICMTENISFLTKTTIKVFFTFIILQKVWRNLPCKYLQTFPTCLHRAAHDIWLCQAHTTKTARQVIARTAPKLAKITGLERNSRGRITPPMHGTNFKSYFIQESLSFASSPSYLIYTSRFRLVSENKWIMYYGGVSMPRSRRWALVRPCARTMMTRCSESDFLRYSFWL